MQRTKKITAQLIYVLSLLILVASILVSLLFVVLPLVVLHGLLDLPDFIQIATGFVSVLWILLTANESYVGTFYILYAYYGIIGLSILHFILHVKEKGLRSALIHPTALIAYIVAGILILL